MIYERQPLTKKAGNDMLRVREPRYMLYSMIAALILLALWLAVFVDQLALGHSGGLFVLSIILVLFSLAALIFTGTLWKRSRAGSH